MPVSSQQDRRLVSRSGRPGARRPRGSLVRPLRQDETRHLAHWADQATCSIAAFGGVA